MAVSFIHKTVALSMAILMFITSMGFTVDLHYCQNQLKGANLFGKARSCHEKKAHCHLKKKYCQHDEKATQEEKNNCCHNEQVTVESLDADAPPLSSTNLIDTLWECYNWGTTSFLLPDCNYSFLPTFQHYKPPVPDKDIRVLYQTFLI